MLILFKLLHFVIVHDHLKKNLYLIINFNLIFIHFELHLHDHQSLICLNHYLPNLIIKSILVVNHHVLKNQILLNRSDSIFKPILLQHQHLNPKNLLLPQFYVTHYFIT